MKTTVYIPSYNASRTLSCVLDAIFAQTLQPDQVLLVDDGSTDASAEIAARYADRGVELLRQDENRGLAAARNRALVAATGDLLVGLDADVRPESDYLEKTVACFARFPNVGAMCGRLLEEHASTAADRWRSVHMSQDPGKESSDHPRFLFGCTTSIRREVARRLGGWDERFTHSYEDVDLTERLRHANIALRYEASCIAYHLKRDTDESVLTSFWRWFYPAGELAGQFDSLETWVQQRIEPVQWSLFRHRFAADLEGARDALLPLTLLMPWWMTALDLDMLGQRDDQRASEIESIRESLPGIAREVLESRNAPVLVEQWIGSRLLSARSTPRGLPVSSGPVPRAAQSDRHLARTACESEAVREALDRIRESATASIPSDAAVWNRMAAAIAQRSNKDASESSSNGATLLPDIATADT